MNIKITYPEVSKKVFQRKKYLHIVKWPLLILAFSCVVVNIVTGGPTWWPVALMGLYMLWTLVLNTDLVEYNRISQFIKATFYSCILVFLIDKFLDNGGWGLDVISIVSFGSIVIAATLFYTDFNRQKQNMLPIFILILIALIWSTVGLFTALELQSWPLIVLGSLAILFFISIIVTLRGDFIREINCRFHIK